MSMTLFVNGEFYNGECLSLRQENPMFVLNKVSKLYEVMVSCSIPKDAFNLILPHDFDKQFLDQLLNCVLEAKNRYGI